MKLPLPPDFFPPVQLSAHEKTQLMRVETQLLSGYLERYEACCLLDNHYNVDTAMWKFMKQHDGFHVYKRRSKLKKQQQQPTYQEFHPLERHHQHFHFQHVKHSNLPAMLVVGSLDGTLEDVLYGKRWLTPQERLERAYFTDDGVTDATVLHTLEKPSTIDPFRSLAVKWTIKKAPSAALIIKDRDFCFLASTGMMRSSHGEKIGYELRHSIQFPSCPPFQNSSVVRGQFYFCSFFRQIKNNRVEVYHQGSYDMAGGLLRTIAAQMVAKSFTLHFPRVVDCAFAKKLVRAIVASEERAHKLSMTSVQDSVTDDRRCGVCLNRLGASSKRSCAICQHCCVRKEIEFATETKTAIARCFCRSCLAKVLRDDASIYAVRDAQDSEIREKMEKYSRRRSSKWDYDHIDTEDVGESDGLTHPILLYAPDSCQFPVDSFLSKKSSLRSMYSTAYSSSSNLDDVRSPTNRRRRNSNPPANVLLRSDAGKRHWNSSTTALSLRSPQSTKLKSKGDEVIIQRKKRRSHRRIVSASPRNSSSMVRLSFESRSSDGSVTTKKKKFLRRSGNVSTKKSQFQHRFFRDLYTK